MARFASYKFDGIHLSASTPRMLLRHPDLIRKGGHEHFAITRRLHLLRRFALPAAEQFMPMFILKRPFRWVHHVLLVMDFAPFFHDCPPVPAFGGAAIGWTRVLRAMCCRGQPPALGEILRCRLGNEVTNYVDGRSIEASSQRV